MAVPLLLKLLRPLHLIRCPDQVLFRSTGIAQLHQRGLSNGNPILSRLNANARASSAACTSAASFC